MNHPLLILLIFLTAVTVGLIVKSFQDSKKIRKLEDDIYDYGQWFRRLETVDESLNRKIYTLQGVNDKVLKNSSDCIDICQKAINDIYSHLGMKLNDENN